MASTILYIQPYTRGFSDAAHQSHGRHHAGRLWPDRGCGHPDRGRPHRLGRPARRGAVRHATTDCEGRLATPGLIDCHTHLVYGGSRAHEFEQRLTGVSYAEIAKAGGGIASTVRATRTQSEADLAASALRRLDALLAEGVTTIEVKSGYGLDRDTEMKMLKVARELGQWRPVDVVTSYLGAHALPPEFKDNREGYLDLVCSEVMPAVAEAKLADAVDAFCEGIAFSVEETRRVFEAAKALGLPVKLHAEQLSNLGGSKMAADFGALSVDHIEYLDQTAGWTPSPGPAPWPCCCPAPSITCARSRPRPVAALRQAGVPIAVATDLNPGTSPVHSILTAMNMACVLFGLTPEEALRGVTDNAAKALGLYDRGLLTPGMKADIALWNTERPGDLAYPLGFNPLAAVIQNGRPCGAYCDERRPAALRQGEGPHPREHPLRRLGGGPPRALRERAGGKLRHQPHDGQPRAARIDGRRLPQPRARRGHLREGNAGPLEPHGASQHRGGDRPARPPLFLARRPQGGDAANPALAEEFEDRGLEQLFHIVIVHEENGVPVQLEDRHVNPAVVPDFL